MAPKRPTPLNESAPLSSDEEREEDLIDGPEDDDDEEEEVQETETKTKKQDSESEEEEEEESEESEEEEDTPLIPPSIEKKPSVQKPNPAPTPNRQSDSDSDESDSDSESDSDTQQQHSPTASDFTIKPIVSKPISKPAAIPLKPSPKRPAETQQNDKRDSRRKKSKVSNGDDEEKKLAINRLWSEDDEIAILKGMIDYQLKKGSDPYADMGAFHIFIKESLHVDVSKNQLTDKIRRLKKKYRTNAEKGEKGEDPVFSRPHEHKSFELSKKIWGSESSNGVEENVKTNNSKAKRSGGGGNVIKSNNSNSKNGTVNYSVAKPKEDTKEIAYAKEIVVREPLKDEKKADQVDFGSMYPQLSEALSLEKSVYLSLPKGGRDFVKEKGSLIVSTKAKELEERWKNLQVEEVELFLKKVDLIQEQTKLVLNAVKASNS